MNTIKKEIKDYLKFSKLFLPIFCEMIDYFQLRSDSFPGGSISVGLWRSVRLQELNVVELVKELKREN